MDQSKAYLSQAFYKQVYLDVIFRMRDMVKDFSCTLLYRAVHILCYLLSAKLYF